MGKDGNCKECISIVQTICPLCGNIIEVCSQPEQRNDIKKGLAIIIKLNIQNKKD